MRVIGYVRVSDVGERNGERFIAVDEQEAAIERFIAAKGYELIDIEKDLDASGGTLERPGLTSVLDRLERADADAIAVAYLSRLSRRVLDGLAVVQRVTEGGRYVLVSDLDLDTSTPIGRAVLTVLLAFAELELEQRRDSWAAAQRRALERGVYPGSTSIAFKRDETGRMIPNPETAPIISRLYDRRLSGGSWAKLARILDAELPRPDGKRWQASTVRSLLKTPFNIGRLERKVGGELIVVEDAHEPIVSRAVWEAVADGLVARGPVRRREPAMLAGLVRCACCGGPMSRGTGGRSTNAAGERVEYDAYVCTTRCERPAKISVPRADGFVLQETLDRLAAGRAVGATRRTGSELEADERELEQAEAEHAAYLRAVSVTDVGEGPFAQGARSRYGRVVNARRKLASTASRVRSAGPTYVELLERLGDPSTPDGEKNVLLRTLIESVVVEKAGKPGRGGDVSKRVSIVLRDDSGEGALELDEQALGERASVAA
jgi:DNA invertase Pin-like site-specific DNA recombinase